MEDVGPPIRRRLYIRLRCPRRSFPNLAYAVRSGAIANDYQVAVTDFAT